MKRICLFFLLILEILEGGWSMNTPNKVHPLVKQVINWASHAFTGEKPFSPPVKLKLLRQDFALLQFGESCMNTPLKIGSKHFEYGLGTHANSEILLDVPKGAKLFK